ncbi:hypothetical protein QJQ45_019624, partial [Haematococcus lacustris]
VEGWAISATQASRAARVASLRIVGPIGAQLVCRAALVEEVGDLTLESTSLTSLQWQNQVPSPACDDAKPELCCVVNIEAGSWAGGRAAACSPATQGIPCPWLGKPPALAASAAPAGAACSPQCTACSKLHCSPCLATCLAVESGFGSLAILALLLPLMGWVVTAACSAIVRLASGRVLGSDPKAAACVAAWLWGAVGEGVGADGTVGLFSRPGLGYLTVGSLIVTAPGQPPESFRVKIGKVRKNLTNVHCPMCPCRWLRPVYSEAKRSQVRGLMSSTSYNIRFYDRDVSAALNIRRCAVGPGPRPTELCYWDGRPAMPKPGRPGQEWVYLRDKALLRKWRRKWRR